MILQFKSFAFQYYFCKTNAIITRVKKENEERSGSAAKKKKVCPYFDLLQFLKVTKQSRNSFSNVTSREH